MLQIGTHAGLSDSINYDIKGNIITFAYYEKAMYGIKEYGKSQI